MRQLQGMDASFVALETRNSPMHIGSILVYNPETAPGSFVRFKDILQFIGDRAQLSRTMRQRLVRVPFDLDYPYWVEDPDFDLEYHVRHVALPRPGDWRQLCIQAARIFARPLDLDRPPWEFTVIEGLDNVPGVTPGSFAMVTKVHHAAIDGMSGIDLMEAMHTLRADDGPPDTPDTWKPEKVPNPAELLGKSYFNAVTNPLKQLEVAAKAAPGLAKAIKGLVAKGGAKKPTYTDVFSDWLCDAAAAEPRLYGITPAMREGSGLVRFAQEFPERYFDVGIAEQHAVTFAAGLACEGFKPVVAIYSTFLQRAYDQLIHDVALQNLPVVFALDRAGIVGADGATHMGAFDIAFVRCIPNMSMIAPADEAECRQALSAAYAQNHPVCVRYPRGAGAGVPVPTDLTPLPWGKAEVRRQVHEPVAGKRVAILAFGTLLYPALQAGEALDATVVNMRFVKPLDTELLLEMAGSHDLLVTVEEGCVQGGAGSAVAEALSAAGVNTPLMMLGLPDAFVEHGEPAKLLALCGLDAEGIEQAVRERRAQLAG